jgi:hypothetical protein
MFLAGQSAVEVPHLLSKLPIVSLEADGVPFHCIPKHFVGHAVVPHSEPLEVDLVLNKLNLVPANPVFVGQVEQ